MGMYLQMVTLGDANIARLLAAPPLVHRLVHTDDAGDAGDAAKPAVKRSLWSRWFRRDEHVPSRLRLGAGEGERADLDKAWHGIHYLLTGTAWEGVPPLDFLVAARTTVGDEEVGYGRASVLTAAETRAVAAALRAVDDATLRSRFDAADMMAKEIYPDIWDRGPGEDDTFAYLLEHVRALRSFVDGAVTKGMGIVSWIS